jgi:hypothetical protein
MEVDAILFDEPAPRSVYISLARGGRTKGRQLRIILAGTPISAAWMRTEIYEPWSRGELPLVECFSGKTEENAENLADGYIGQFSARLSEKERKIRLEGQFFDLDGLALASLYSPETHLVSNKANWQKENPVVVAIDPHPSKNHVACMVGIDKDDQLVYLKELSIKQVPREFARTLKRWYADHRVVDIVVDSLGAGQMTGGEGFKSFIDVLQEEGIRCRATTWVEKGDEQFITRIQEALSMPVTPDNFGRLRPKLMIKEGCHGIIHDIQNVQWVVDKSNDSYKPKLEIGHLDYLACLKYALAANVKFARNGNKPYVMTKPLYGIPVRPMTWGVRRK